MTKKELAAKLRALAVLSGSNPERFHRDADDLLIEFIGDDGVRDAYEEVKKWYS